MIEKIMEKVNRIFNGGKYEITSKQLNVVKKNAHLIEGMEVGIEDVRMNDRDWKGHFIKQEGEYIYIFSF
jgi:hypothetical protein